MYAIGTIVLKSFGPRSYIQKYLNTWTIILRIDSHDFKFSPSQKTYTIWIRVSIILSEILKQCEGSSVLRGNLEELRGNKE